MFQFGLFSTHIPYIITIVVYLLSYGYYALNKPEPSSENIISKTDSGNHIHLKNSIEKHHLDAFHFDVNKKGDVTAINNHCPAIGERFDIPNKDHNVRLSSLLNTFELLSRPPTQSC
ncbi:hypothetical protein [Alistipes sp. ZOR0009]|jgi:hypothetical protein|uniref:hypothetical protein n=1 Tax=Alistipes sp. ZOR0009 TaxID=1339253 RepID=UPI0006474C14|nr:hypothetical protein [Alistipes sp. ZOR0009]